MKARVKETGEIVDGYEFNGGFVCIRNRVRDSWLLGSEFELITEPETITASFDWESFRNETASKAMQGLLSNNSIVDNHNDGGIEWVANHAILQADELIKQLKSTL